MSFRIKHKSMFFKLNQQSYIIFYFSLLLIFSFSGCKERKVSVEHLKNKPENQHEKITEKIFSEEELIDQGFITSTDVESIADPNAVKGGTITIAMSEFPPTFRTIGKNTHLVTISLIEGMTFESLLYLNSKTLDYQQNLATHWKISKDKKTYWFRINPQAKWSDGRAVLAKDVVSTYRLLTDSGIKDPAVVGLFSENYFLPEAISRYVVKVKCRKDNWRSFMYFALMSIFPSYHIDKVDGASYLKKYQFQMFPGSGPYQIDLSSTKKGKQLVLKRRENYWGKLCPQNKGLYNFDKIKMIVVMDERLQLEKFKKGEIDLYMPSRARWWLSELNAKNVNFIKRGLILKRKIFNFKPLGMAGLAFNTQEKPFNDIKVRKAFSLLWDVNQLIEKLFCGEYERCHSYFQGTVFENLNNPAPEYNPLLAMELLKEAGWKKNENEPFLRKEGEIFEIDLMIDSGMNFVFTKLQQDLQKAGIKLNLVNTTGHAVFKNIMQKKFKIAYLGWTGLLFPNPETSMHSKYAKISDTNNITGIQIPRVDEICELYDKSYDILDRIKLLKELDSILTNEQNYAFGWVAPYAARIAFWNRFGYPKSGLTYSGDWRAIFGLWWIDPDKENILQKAKKDKKMNLAKGKEWIDYWNKQQEKEL